MPVLYGQWDWLERANASETPYPRFIIHLV
jgi:hypothetical protein